MNESKDVNDLLCVCGHRRGAHKVGEWECVTLLVPSCDCRRFRTPPKPVAPQPEGEAEAHRILDEVGRCYVRLGTVKGRPAAANIVATALTRARGAEGRGRVPDLEDRASQLMDEIIDAAVEWHQSGREGDDTWFDKAGALGDAVDALLALRDGTPKPNNSVKVKLLQLRRIWNQLNAWNTRVDSDLRSQLEAAEARVKELENERESDLIGRQAKMNAVLLERLEVARSEIERLKPLAGKIGRTRRRTGVCFDTRRVCRCYSRGRGREKARGMKASLPPI